MRYHTEQLFFLLSIFSTLIQGSVLPLGLGTIPEPMPIMSPILVAVRIRPNGLDVGRGSLDNVSPPASELSREDLSSTEFKPVLQPLTHMTGSELRAQSSEDYEANRQGSRQSPGFQSLKKRASETGGSPAPTKDNSQKKETAKKWVGGVGGQLGQYLPMTGGILKQVSSNLGRRSLVDASKSLATAADATKTAFTSSADAVSRFAPMTGGMLRGLSNNL